jgi:hypothetical protein
MTPVTLNLLQMSGSDDFSCDGRTFVLPFVLQVNRLQGGNFKIQTAGGMHHDFIALPDDVAERIAAGRQQIAVLSRIRRGEFALIDQQLGSGAAGPFIAEVLVELIAPTQGQFPRIPGGSTVTIRTFDFHIGQ